MRFKWEALFDGREQTAAEAEEEKAFLEAEAQAAPLSWTTDPKVLRLARFFIFEPEMAKALAEVEEDPVATLALWADYARWLDSVEGLAPHEAGHWTRDWREKH